MSWDFKVLIMTLVKSKSLCSGFDIKHKKRFTGLQEYTYFKNISHHK